MQTSVDKERPFLDSFVSIIHQN